MGQSALPVALMPVYPKTAWEKCLVQAIAYLQRNWRPFCCFGPSQKCGSCLGGTENHSFRDKTIITRGRHFRSCDNGAVFEAFFLAWCSWMEVTREKKRDLSYEQMDELVRRCFFIDSIDIYISEYPTGFISGLLKLPSWLPWFSLNHCSVEMIEDPRDLRFGDFCRVREGRNPKEGYTVIVLGEGWENGEPVVYTWSSHAKYNQKWEHGFGMKPGIGCSYFSLRKRINGWKRKFYGARLVDKNPCDYEFVSQIISQ